MAGFKWKETSTKCVKIIPENVSTWDEAYETCSKEYNGTLLTVNSQFEQDFVTAVLGLADPSYKMEGFWTAGRYIANQGKLIWYHVRNKRLEYTNWAFGAPRTNTNEVNPADE